MGHRADRNTSQMSPRRITIQYSSVSLAGNRGWQGRGRLFRSLGELLVTALLISPADAVKPVIVPQSQFTES